MFLRIETLPAKKLIGMCMRMSLVDNKTADLWRNFMSRRREISQAIGKELYSMQVYEQDYYTRFSPANAFTKWAAVEVSAFDTIPEGMEAVNLPEGMYAVFLHRGPASAGDATFQYIFGTWLPASGFVLDDRPHFELLGDKYKNDAPDSEEEIWIPVREQSAVNSHQ